VCILSGITKISEKIFGFKDSTFPLQIRHRSQSTNPRRVFHFNRAAGKLNNNVQQNKKEKIGAIIYSSIFLKKKKTKFSTDG
jgi:acetylglutamate synthase